MSLIKQIYKPSMTVGQVYARPYRSATPRLPVGNVLALELAHNEDVKKQADMTRPGGGTYAQVRRVKDVTLTMELADWNGINFARAVFGTAVVVEAGTETDKEYQAFKGGLIRLAHPSPSDVIVKKGATVIDAVNYEPRPEGIFVFPDAPGFTDAEAVKISYSYPEHLDIEALTSASPELELTFGGLNEADSGKPVIVDIWRLGTGIVKSLALIQAEFGTLKVEGEVLVDPTKTGAGVSRFYRAQMV